MAASEIAYDIQTREGWTDTTLLDVVLDYIDNQEADTAFADYLAERSSAEPESTITVTCPVVDPDGNGIEGCGRTYSAVPDDEGMIDCPHCGMCFDPAHPNSQPQPAKFHRTVFEVEVLSREPVAEDLGLDGLHYEITEGGMSGEVTRSVTEVVNAARMAELLANQGSDPEFFGIGCTHENQRVGDDNQFHCVDCGAWLGR